MAKHAGLFKYVVRVVGLFRSINDYVVAYDDEQALGKVKARYPRQYSYNVVKRAPVGGKVEA